jgi:hypothetical protein
MSDPYLALLVELRELRRHVTNVECAVRDAMEYRGRSCATHGFAPPQHVAPFCSEAMDELEESEAERQS